MINMRKSRLSVYKQDRLIEHFVSGSTARTAASLVGVNKSTAAYFYCRLREIIGYTDMKFLTVKLKSMKAILAASVRANVAVVRQGKSRYLAF
jgi:transposase-like protein